MSKHNKGLNHQLWYRQAKKAKLALTHEKESNLTFSRSCRIELSFLLKDHDVLFLPNNPSAPKPKQKHNGTSIIK